MKKYLLLLFIIILTFLVVTCDMLNPLPEPRDNPDDPGADPETVFPEFELKQGDTIINM